MAAVGVRMVRRVSLLSVSSMAAKTLYSIWWPTGKRSGLGARSGPLK